MPNIGRETAGATAQNFETYMLANPVTMTEDGDIESITAYLAESSNANAHNVKAIVYDSSGNVLGESTARADLTTTPGWVTFTFGTPVSVTNTQALRLAVAAGSGTGVINCYRDTGVSGDGYEAAMVGYPTIPNPTTLVTKNFTLSIYATYTATGGSVAGAAFHYYRQSQ